MEKKKKHRSRIFIIYMSYFISTVQAKSLNMILSSEKKNVFSHYFYGFQMFLIVKSSNHYYPSIDGKTFFLLENKIVFKLLTCIVFIRFSYFTVLITFSHWFHCVFFSSHCLVLLQIVAVTGFCFVRVPFVSKVLTMSTRIHPNWTQAGFFLKFCSSFAYLL